jgi:hypothetical protein
MYDSTWFSVEADRLKKMKAPTTRSTTGQLCSTETIPFWSSSIRMPTVMMSAAPINPRVRQRAHGQRRFRE